ncbi:unnamed protein product [Aspergillus oryzae RIB40]|uniref:DNA, SC038 n=1 Tax=Aspergillus oryzae (strain ATCC 42149 / RIB 40) TaxID=510516 RepID=Q2U3F0_ASPOR|nr:unnamed protein product [Aspergillus oryzae RIB40]BAE63915.1 unnamed protein product [Aspergillus oryzae RIB40]
MGVNSAFLHAATIGDATTIENEYLKDKSILTAKDADGRTALHLAALHKDVKVLELLLNYGIEPSTTDNRGQTALHIAAQQSSLAVVELLLKRRANWSIRDHDGNTPLSYAYQQYSVEILRQQEMDSSPDKCQRARPLGFVELFEANLEPKHSLRKLSISDLQMMTDSPDDQSNLIALFI